MLFLIWSCKYKLLSFKKILGLTFELQTEEVHEPILSCFLIFHVIKHIYNPAVMLVSSLKQRRFILQRICRWIVTISLCRRANILSFALRFEAADPTVTLARH